MTGDQHDQSYQSCGRDSPAPNCAVIRGTRAFHRLVAVLTREDRPRGGDYTFPAVHCPAHAAGCTHPSRFALDVQPVGARRVPRCDGGPYALALAQPRAVHVGLGELRSGDRANRRCAASASSARVSRLRPGRASHQLRRSRRQYRAGPVERRRDRARLCRGVQGGDGHADGAGGGSRVNRAGPVAARRVRPPIRHRVAAAWAVVRHIWRRSGSSRHRNRPGLRLRLRHRGQPGLARRPRPRAGRGRWMPVPLELDRGSFEFPAPFGRRRMSRYGSGEVMTVPRHTRTREVRTLITTTSLCPHPALLPVFPVLRLVISLARRTPGARGLLRWAASMAARRGSAAAPAPAPPGTSTLQAPSPDAGRRFVVVAEASGPDGSIGRAEAFGGDFHTITAALLAHSAVTLAGGHAVRSRPASFVAPLAQRYRCSRLHRARIAGPPLLALGPAPANSNHHCVQD